MHVLINTTGGRACEMMTALEEEKNTVRILRFCFTKVVQGFQFEEYNSFLLFEFN